MLIPLHHWGIFKQLVWLDGFEPTAFCTSSRCTYPLYDNHISQNDVFRTVMRTRVLPGWYLSCSNLRCFSAESALPYAHPSSLDDLTSFISINSVPGRRLERPIFALGERCISIMLPRHHYILTTNTVPNYLKIERTASNNKLIAPIVKPTAKYAGQKYMKDRLNITLTGLFHFPTSPKKLSSPRSLTAIEYTAIPKSV